MKRSRQVPADRAQLSVDRAEVRVAELIDQRSPIGREGSDVERQHVAARRAFRGEGIPVAVTVQRRGEESTIVPRGEGENETAIHARVLDPQRIGSSRITAPRTR